MEEKLNEQELQNTPDNVDNDLMPETDDDLIVGGDADGEALPVSDDAIPADADIGDVEVGEPALNQSAEFLRKFADSFSEAFVIDLPKSDAVKASLAEAKATAEKRLKEQINKENRRKKALVAKLAELQKQQ